MSANPFSKAVEFAGHQLDFFADRALFWPAAQTLIVADVHIGKAASFRALGVPVPGGCTEKDLGRLSVLIEHTAAARLLIVGDFLHAAESHVCMDRVAVWRAKHAGVAMELVIGNHDKKAGAIADELRIAHIAGEYEDGGLHFVHDPAHADAAKPTIAGHIHPQAMLSDFDGSGMRVPCYVMDPNLLILPSFGSFTGGHCLPNVPGRRRFIAAAGRVVELPAPRLVDEPAAEAGRTTPAARPRAPRAAGPSKGRRF